MGVDHFDAILPQWLMALQQYTPSPSVLVGNIAFTFRVFAIALFMPIIILVLMDLTAYVIARTLHAPRNKAREALKNNTPPPTLPTLPPMINVQPSSPHPETLVSPSSTNSSTSSDTNANTNTKPDASNPSISSASSSSFINVTRPISISPTQSFLGRAPQHGEPQFYFDFGDDMASGHALSGVGIFSPPVTRPTTPTQQKKKRRPFGSLFMTSTGEDAAAGGPKTRSRASSDAESVSESGASFSAEMETEYDADVNLDLDSPMIRKRVTGTKQLVGSDTD